jgi:hypothetical protein
MLQNGHCETYQYFGVLLKSTFYFELNLDIRVVTCHSNDHIVMKGIITEETMPFGS